MMQSYMLPIPYPYGKPEKILYFERDEIHCDDAQF